MTPIQPIRQAIVAVGEPGGAFARVVAIIAEEYAKVLKAPSVVNPDWWTSHDAVQQQAEDSVRSLVNAEVMVIDLDHYPLVAGYVLGARLALTEKFTFGVRAAGEPAPWPKDLAPMSIDPAAGEATIRDQVKSHMQSKTKDALATFQNGFRTSSVVDVKLKRRILHPDGDAITRQNKSEVRARIYNTWTSPQSDKVRVHLTFGDIRDIEDFDCWANSENLEMEMARIVDGSISARIRELGAVWYGEAPNREGDDAMFVALSRRMGARRRVKAGEVIVTPAHVMSELSKTNGVRAVAHVASVQGAGPGKGFEKAGSLGLCVSNLLSTVASHKLAGGAKVGRVLMPLFASGDARVTPMIAASEMAGGLKDWFDALKIKDELRGGITAVSFIAREEDAAEDIRQALDMWGFERQKNRSLPWGYPGAPDDDAAG